MKSILIATDFSSRSQRAVRRATELAKRIGAAVVLVHVVDDDLPEQLTSVALEAAQRLVAELATSLRANEGIETDACVALAAPAAGLARLSGEIAPDLLVLGSHRRQALRDIFIGTTAQRTISMAACPVLMVNGPTIAPYRRILVSTDLSQASGDALRGFMDLGLEAGAKVTVLYVFDAPAGEHSAIGSTSGKGRQVYLEAEQRRASAALSSFLATLGAAHFEQITLLEESTAATEILAQAEAMMADLIVVGTRGKSGLVRLVLGSVAEQVLKSAERDVLAIPPRQAR